jgi:hypothetical protein
MRVEIVPEPAEPLRDALIRGVARELEAGTIAPSAWWQAGLAESVDDEVAYGETAARPRSRRGATRA